MRLLKVFTEWIKLKVRLDPAALSAALRNLNTRLLRVARTFRTGLMNAFKFTPYALGLAVLSKVLNPLKEASEILDRMLNRGDDAATFAEEFGSDPGKLLRLEAIGTAKGLDQATLRRLLLAFQSELAAERHNQANPNNKISTVAPGLLKNFVGETDVAEGFFKFVQAMQALSPDERTNAQQLLFGEKLRGKASEFFNSKDFRGILNELPTADDLARAALGLAELSDKRDRQTAVREAQDIINKERLANEGMIDAIDRGERQRLKSEDESLRQFTDLQNVSEAMNQLVVMGKGFVTNFLNVVAPAIVTGANFIVESVPKIQKTIKDGFSEVRTMFNDIKNWPIVKYFTK